MGVNPKERPLVGKRIVVTRAASQAQALTARLERLGAQTLQIPVIETRAPEDSRALDRVVGELDEYDWIVFASVHGVAAVLERTPCLSGPRIAAVGPTTAAELNRCGVHVALIAAKHDAESLVAELCHQGVADARVLLPQAVGGLPTLQEGLTACGAQVTRVDAYRTALLPIDLEAARSVVSYKVDALTFTSPSTVRGFVQGMEDLGYLPPRRIPVFCIGDTTASAAREAGLVPRGIADPPGLDGLVDVTVTYFTQAKV